MGQESEEAAEFVATVRGDHAKMKEWYMASDAATTLRQNHGNYPALWKEVLNWPGWKDARRAYLKSQQQTSLTEESIPRKRKSRWATAKAPPGQAPPPSKRHTAPPPLNLPGMHLGGPAHHLTPAQQEDLRRMQAQLRRVNDRLDNLEREAARVDDLPRGHRERSPSPPPVYGVDGKRKNTRAVRWRERYTVERQDLLESIMRLRGGRQSSALLVRKRTKKIRIPIDEHPNFNFIGLLIGPRGKTQKELEGKTGCKIAIRGRGSVKEGARGRRDGKVMDGDNEPLHVIVSGDNQKAVDAASDMVEQLLVVIDDEKNVHKQQQLRELALLNGTLKDDEFCEICAEKGHRAFACPKRFAMRKPVATIKCAICGDTSHPTSDCTQKPGTVENKELDSEYQSFMAELDGKKPAAAKLPPPPTNLPPPPANGGPPPPPANLPRPPPPANLPPPRPTNLPPPPAGGQRPPDHNYYGRHQQHQQPNGYGQQQQQGYGQQQQQQPPYPGHGQQQPNQQHQPNQQQQQGRQVRPGEETAGWDPSSYYGSYGGGTGGFNWWEK